MADVFLSYSRKDLSFVRRLTEALKARDRDVWVDLDDIIPSSRWMEEIRTGIAEADAIVFVISPDSVTSEVCRTELDYAAGLPKRLIPIIARETTRGSVPSALTELHWLSFDDDTDFDTAVDRLIEIFDTDIERVHLHTKLLTQAADWEARKHDRSQLLRGAELKEAETWLADQTDRKPAANSAQAKLILASRRAAVRRQRGFGSAGLVLAVVMAVLATFALIQRQTAINQADIARTRQLLAQADALRNRQPDVSLLLNVLALSRAPDAVTEEARSALTANLARPHHIATQVTGHTGPVDAVAFSPDGTTLASASWDGTVRLWEAGTGQPRDQPLTGHTQPTGWSPDPVTGVAFSPDGKTLASANRNGPVRLWDAATGHPLGRPLAGHTNSVTGVAFSLDGKILAAGGRKSTVRLWDAATGQPRGGPLTGHTGSVNGVAFSPDGKMLASASTDSTVRLWDAATGQPRGEPLTGHTNSVSGVAFSPDGKMLASASWDDTVRLWEVAETRPVSPPLTGHTRSVTGVAFSPDGKMLASASADDTVRLWDAATGHARGQPLTGHTGYVNGVTFSPDGKMLASASDDDTVRLWDVATGQPRGQPFGMTTFVEGVAFSPDGKTLASGSWGSVGGTVRLWDVTTGRPQGEPFGHTGGPGLLGEAFNDDVNGVAFSPDGKMLASAVGDDTVRLWDVATGQPRGEPLTGHTGSVNGVAFSPDGKVLASASDDGTVRLWDAATGHPLGEPLTGHTGSVEGVAFSPDGKVLASASDDGTVRLWDVATGQPSGQPLTGHTGVVNGVAFSPDGKMLASAGVDGTVRLWSVKVKSLIDQACRIANRNMSRTEWNRIVGSEVPYIRICPSS